MLNQSIKLLQVMLNQLIAHFNFTLAFIALITLIEIFINFKRPLTLKYILIILILFVLIQNLGYLFFPFGKTLLWLTGISRTIIGFAGLSLIYFLITNKINKYILLFGFLILTIHMAFLLFRTNTFPLNQFTNIQKNNLVENIRIFFRSISSFAVILLLFKIFINLKRRLNKQNTYHENIKRWIITSLLVVIFGCITNILMINLHKNTIIEFEKISILLFDMLICLNTLFRPKIVNKVRVDYSLSNLFNKNHEKEIDQELFFNEFFVKSFYTRNSTSLEDLSELIGVDSNELNNFIFLKYGCSLSDLVNKSRIELFSEMIQKGTNKDLTIEAIAKIVGFGSRQSLARSFKKFHGGSPSDLIRATEMQ